MIIDALLLLPTLLIAFFWELLEAGEGFPDGVYTAGATAGNYLARLDFILPIDTMGSLLGWYLVAVLAYLFLWILLMTIGLYKAFKLF